MGRQIMGTIDEYIKLPCTLRVQNGDSGRYMVSYPDLKGRITCTDTMEAAIANVKDAKLAWLEAALEPV